MCVAINDLKKLFHKIAFWLSQYSSPPPKGISMDAAAGGLLLSTFRESESVNKAEIQPVRFIAKSEKLAHFLTFQ